MFTVVYMFLIISTAIDMDQNYETPVVDSLHLPAYNILPHGMYSLYIRTYVILSSTTLLTS